MLTIEQQQAAIVVLAVVAALVVILALAGGAVWYLMFKKGYTAIALVLLLPVLWLTTVFLPIVWLIWGSIEGILEAHDAANRAPRYELAGGEAAVTAQKFPRAPAIAAPAMAEAKPEDAVPQTPTPADTKPAA